MAKHTITVIHKTVGGNARAENKNKKTSGDKKNSNSSNVKKIKPGMAINKTLGSHFDKFAKGFFTYKIISKSIQEGVNLGSTIYEAASGETIRASNIRAQSNILFDPLGFATSVAKQSFLGNLRINRANQALNYQRQLTGELAFSKSLNDGTF
jgi:hypothetical protein